MSGLRGASVDGAGASGHLTCKYSGPKGPSPLPAGFVGSQLCTEIYPAFKRGFLQTVPRGSGFLSRHSFQRRRLSSANILVNMFNTLTGFTYRGLSPHKFTPMAGVHKWLQWTAPHILWPIAAHCLAKSLPYKLNSVWATTEPSEPLDHYIQNYFHIDTHKKVDIL